MSKIALTPNPSGTGTLTLAAPNTNTDRTITLPDATTTLVGTDATQTLTNKSIAASQLTGALPALDGSALTNLPAPAQLSTATGSAPSYSCRAWVNFNGTGTVAIRASGNVTSITDNAVGQYTVNFTTEMPDTDYATVFSYDKSVVNTSNQWSWYTVISSSQVKLNIHQGSYVDATTVTAAIFR